MVADSSSTFSGDDDLFDTDQRRHRDTESLAMSPSHIQFMLTYEHLQDEAAEAEYAQKTTRQKVISGLCFALLALLALYFFMVAIKLIGDGVTLMLSCSTKDAFAFTNNPIAGLLIGTVATALIHSSSTVTSLTVAVVGSGGMTIRQGVFMIMGANVGTCITCMMVAFGQVGDRARFQRAMAAATVHDMYNIWSVLVMFPIEVFFQPLEMLCTALANWHTNGGSFASPVDAVVNPLTDQIMKIDKKMLNDAAAGTVNCSTVDSFITIGVFREAGLSDGAVGGILLAIGIVTLFCSLISLVRTLAKVFLGPTKRIISTVLEYNGYVNILVGTIITFAVHSSTVVTSTLTPMAGLGVITLEQVYPLVIGANLGTTTNAMLASLVLGKSSAVAMALTHFFFNLFGIVLFYPLPVTRKPILKWARSLAHYSASWPMTAVIFLVLLFVVLPAVGLGLVYLCTAENIAVVSIGYVLFSLVLVHITALCVWYYRYGGRNTWYKLLEKKRVEREIRKYGGNLGLPSFVDDGSDLEYPV